MIFCAETFQNEAGASASLLMMASTAKMNNVSLQNPLTPEFREGISGKFVSSRGLPHPCSPGSRYQVIV